MTTKNSRVQRSEIMRAVKGKNTSPEMIVRRFLHARGFRFRLHGEDLPGKPDIILPKRKIIIRVMGCFWHGHQCNRGARIPKTNRKYWLTKIARNKQRDMIQKKQLRSRKWQVLDIWECQVKNESKLMALVAKIH